MSNTVYNANNQQLNFDGTNVLNIVGNGKGNGDVVRFNSVITIGGQAIDAVVTTTLSGASVTTYDGTSAASGQTAFFQPNLSVTDPGVGGIGGVRFNIDFYKGGTFTGVGTGQAVTLQNVVVNSYDIDSVGPDSSQRQFQDFKGFAQYELATATELTATVQADGSVRFQYSPSGSPTNNGTYTADGYRVKVYYDSISSFELLTGATKAASGTWSGTSYFALDFSVGPSWTGATTLTGTPSANVTYNSGTFTESAANDGSISNTITLTLANDTYAADVVSSNKIVATNVPAGLSATFVRTSNTVITATLTGNASAHANANDINNLTFSFQNGAFVTHTTAADVTGFTKGDLIVNFNDPSPALSYSASTFTEAVANDGSISNTLTITLANDTFTGTNGAALSGVTVTNVPAGLTATVTRVNATEATLALTGSATAHANANDISNLTVTFGNAAFTGNNAAAVTNAVKNNLVVDFADPAPVPAPTPTPPPTPQPPVQPTPPFSADLDPASDTGVRDNVTMITAPDFTLNGGSYLSTGGSARLLDASGQVIGSSSVTAADIQAGTINVTTGQLDDGQYTFQAQVLNAAGQVVASAPVTVTVVTDRDGIKPSVELAANNGDYNQDGTPDWQQNNVAQLPLLSLADFQAGINAPASTFGAIIAGTVDSTHPSTPVKLDAGAQLLDLSISAIPAPLPDNTVAGSAMFNFSVTAQTGAALTDIAPDRAGLQTQVVIDLPTGITANAYMKYNAVTGAWTNFANPAALDGSQDGAALVDTVGDGKVHRIVITLTDGGAGDEDGTVNGVIVDPGLLAFIASPPPAAPPATPVYSVRLASGDRFYTTSVSEAATMAKGSANVFEGVRFDSLDSAQGGVHQVANHNPFTNDWYFAVDGGAMPYACYQQIKTLAGFSAAAAGKGPGEDFHLYLNGMGLTQLVTQAEAASLGLTSKGYMDRGAVFNTTTTSAFAFDAEAYLVANKNDATIQNLVKSLSGSYTSTSDGQFIEAVEQQYLTQVGLVGTAVVHGTTATAADLNAAFGTHFLA